MKRYVLGLVCACGVCFGGGGDWRERSGFELYGDVMQVLPFAMMAYSYAIDDMQGVAQQALGAGVSFLGTHAIKQGFVALSKSNEDRAWISKRPDSGSFDGFPSGHTSFVFSTAGFAQKRYGWKWGVPLSLVAASVGASRVHARRHTTTQVIAGAALGFLTSYLIASPFEQKAQLNAWVDSAIDGTPSYHVGYMRRF